MVCTRYVHGMYMVCTGYVPKNDGSNGAKSCHSVPKGSNGAKGAKWCQISQNTDPGSRLWDLGLTQVGEASCLVSHQKCQGCRLLQGSKCLLEENWKTACHFLIINL